MSGSRWTEGLSPDERTRIERFEDVLGDDAAWDDPPNHLRNSIMDAVTAERSGGEATTEASEKAGAPDQGHGGVVIPVRPPHQRWSRWVTVAAVAAATAIIIFIPRGDEAATFVVAGTELAPEAQASAEVTSLPAGVAIKLEITGLPAAEPGTYYSTWLMGPDGIVPAGSFHWREGGVPVGLWSGVEPDEYPDFFVTLQEENRDPGPSEIIVMRGDFSAFSP